MTSADGRDPSGPEADDLLRPAAELAIEMARAGLRMQPPVDVPSRLRPVLGHAKVTRAALATVRRVLEDDPAFRSRVAAAMEVPAASAAVGRAGVLWLGRPEGWEAELEALVSEARTAAAARAEGAGERTAQRRLRHAEEARDRAERAAGDAQKAAEGARAEAQEERRLRRATDEAAARNARHAASLEEQLAAARRGLEAAAARLVDKTSAEAATAVALSSAEAELRHLRAEVAGLRTALSESMTDGAQTAPIPAATPPSTDRALQAERRALGEAVAAASDAAVALGVALGQAAAALDASGAAGEAESPAEGLPEGGHGRRPTLPRSARRRGRRVRRWPAPLPPLVRDDSAEAAEHLVSLPAVALLVDGYNATLSTWPGLPLPEQRRRLVDALAELAARTGARPEVVFDGADVVADRPGDRTVRSLVKVSFTASDVEADDVLIARAHDRPLPVVVASDDRRVQDGARAAGANVLGIEQLLAALRRAPRPPQR